MKESCPSSKASGCFSSTALPLDMSSCVKTIIKYNKAEEKSVGFKMNIPSLKDAWLCILRQKELSLKDQSTTV